MQLCTSMRFSHIFSSSLRRIAQHFSHNPWDKGADLAVCAPLHYSGQKATLLSAAER